ncbi:MAG TPA: hypothetical protein DIT99_22750 [Candidatus Latescibacteria bacterium]|jgi:hypothetical protein|nr:hypothetical protein [Candidatus Latescibacterota bacterium]
MTGASGQYIGKRQFHTQLVGMSRAPSSNRMIPKILTTAVLCLDPRSKEGIQGEKVLAFE